MNKNILLVVLMIFIINCKSLIVQTAYNFNPKEEKILSATTNVIGFDYGYDTDLETSYIFKIDNLNIDVKKNIGKFNNKLKMLNADELSLFYKKIYELMEGIAYLVSYSKSHKKWPIYNHLNNEILYPVKEYERLLSNYFKNKYSSRYNSIDKKTIKRDIILYYQTKHSIVDEY